MQLRSMSALRSAPAAPAAPSPFSTLPGELLARILHLAPDTAGELLRLCGVSAAFRRALGTPSAARALASRGGLVWRRVFDRLDPCAALLHPDAAPHSCDGYLEHAVRLSGADGLQPGWLKLAHALADNACVACGTVTRFVAWRADGADGQRRCCPGCALPAGSGESGDKTEVSLINEQFFSREPVKVIDATTLSSNAARMQLQVAIFEAEDGDTVALCGSFLFDDDDVTGAFGCFAAGMGRAIRLLGLPRPPHMPPPPPLKLAWHAESRESFLAAEAALGEAPFTRIHVCNNGIELYAPGVMLENLVLGSGDLVDFGGLDEVPSFAGLCAFNSTADNDYRGAPSLIVKRCWLHGLQGSSLVMEKGARAAVLQSVFADSLFMHVHANADTVLRISGCHLLDTMVCGMLSLTGEQNEAAVSAIAASNVLAPGSTLLLELDPAPLDGAHPTQLLA